MSDGALVHEKTRVEKVNDTYHYFLTFKNLQFGPLVGTVDSLSIDGKAAERTNLGGEVHEKLFHFTSAEKLTEKTINFSVLANGEPLKGHSNVAATLKFNWNAATPLTADQVTSLHNDETTKAQAEKERLEKEAAAKAQAEKEKLEREKAQKAEADRLEKERLEKEAAAKAQAEKEKAEKEAAAKAQAEKEKLEREKTKFETGEALVQPELPELNEISKAEKGEALVQPELPELNINDLNKEQKAKEQAQPSTQDIFGQNENKEDEKAEAEKTSQTVAKELKALANTGVSSTATVGLGALLLLSALVLRRKTNK